MQAVGGKQNIRSYKEEGNQVVQKQGNRFATAKPICVTRAMTNSRMSFYYFSESERNPIQWHPLSKNTHLATGLEPRKPESNIH